MRYKVLTGFVTVGETEMNVRSGERSHAETHRPGRR